MALDMHLRQGCVEICCVRQTSYVDVPLSIAPPRSFWPWKTRSEKESFNNYVDKTLPNFNHLPPSSGLRRELYILSALCSHDPLWTFY